MFAKLPRHRLNELEVMYWQSVEAADTSAAYRRYLDILDAFLDGRLAAKRRSHTPVWACSCGRSLVPPLARTEESVGVLRSAVLPLRPSRDPPAGLLGFGGGRRRFQHLPPPVTVRTRRLLLKTRDRPLQLCSLLGLRV